MRSRIPFRVSADMNSQMDQMIINLYKMGDIAVACLTYYSDSHAADWLISRFKYMLQNNLATEITYGAQ